MANLNTDKFEVKTHQLPYVCTSYEDLDKPLDAELANQFKSLFCTLNEKGEPTKNPIAWRMYWKGATPQKFLARYGIDFDHPTVRDAIAFDLVKFESDDVSNERYPTYENHIQYSTSEYERMLYHRNYRINLTSLGSGWSDITYGKKHNDPEKESTKTKRSYQYVYQGIRFSETVLKFFDSVYTYLFDNCGDIAGLESAVYIPFTNANDILPEISLMTNVHPDFKMITSRAYYDMKYAKYKKLLKKYGIRAISTYALVDSTRDKTHIGEFLVKVQRQVNEEGKFQYLVFKVDNNGQFLRNEGNLIWSKSESTVNSIVCVCEQDYYKDDRNKLDEEWTTPTPSEVNMVKSTTSSQYSVFRQRIPDYDLKYVRHYLQYRTRLQGMELCLEQLKKDINNKEVQCSECFIQLTLAINNLINEFTRNQELFDIIKKYYDNLHEYDELYFRIIRLKRIANDKHYRLDLLISEYNDLPNSKLNKKIELGDEIKSIKLELDKTIEVQIRNLEEKRIQLIEDTKSLMEDAKRIKNGGLFYNISSDNLEQMQTSFNQKLTSELIEKRDEFSKKSDALKTLFAYNDGEYDKSKLDSASKICESSKTKLQEFRTQFDKNYTSREPAADGFPPLLDDLIDINELNRLILLTEKWNGFMHALGYELSEMKKMLVECDDATIQIRRLIHNFESRMNDVEEQVWEPSTHLPKGNFSFTGITSAGIRDIILLHDWYACNAPEKTYEDMGFKDDSEFRMFRMRCNRIGLSIRRNQYAQMIGVNKDKLQSKIDELNDILLDSRILKYDDKYGLSGQVQESKPWSLDDVSQSKVNKLKIFGKAFNNVRQAMFQSNVGSKSGSDGHKPFLPFIQADAELQEKENVLSLYTKDLDAMKERTISYLIDTGIIESEEGLYDLALRSNVSNTNIISPEELTSRLDTISRLKTKLDDSILALNKCRDSMKSIIDKVYACENEIVDIKSKNERIVNQCIVQTNRTLRNHLLMQKLDNEKRSFELSQILSDVRKNNEIQFANLQVLRDRVDDNQKQYDDAVKMFKDDVQINEESIANLMMGVYNKYQDEIIKHSEVKQNGNA